MPAIPDDEPAQLWRASQDITSDDADVRADAGVELLRLALTAGSRTIQLKASDVLADQLSTFAVGEVLMDSIIAQAVPATAQATAG